MTPAPPAVFRSLAGKPVFRVGEQQYCWEDVILAARRWGDWAGLVAEARDGVACIRHMLATGKRPAAAEEEGAATQFRTTRKLLSAAAAEAWLAERGLSADNWVRYLRRALLRDRWSADLPELVARYPARSDQLRRALRIVGICSGHLMRFAWKLAGRAAVAVLPAIETAAPVLTPPADAPGAALLGLAGGVCQTRLAALVRLEVAYRHFATQIVTPGAIQNLVTGRYTDWMRVEYSTAVFPSEEAADEAVLCVREDGETLTEVANRCRVKAVHRCVFLERLHPALRGPLLSAKKGELLGPLPAEGGFKLCSVLNKLPASIKDEKVYQQAEELLAATAASQEASRRVQWHCQL